jgi:hypothetical protein
MEGTPKDTNHCASGGMPLWKTTRFAGLEIGNTNDAAFAMSGPIIRGTMLVLWLWVLQRQEQDHMRPYPSAFCMEDSM